MFDAVVYFRNQKQAVLCDECKEFTIDIVDFSITDDVYEKLWEHAKTHEPKSRMLSIEILLDDGKDVDGLGSRSIEKA